MQELHLTKMSFSTPGECTKLVSSIPALREVHCVDVHFRMPQAAEVQDTCINRLAPRLHVESLSVRIPTVLCIKSIFRLTAIFSSLTFRHKERIFCLKCYNLQLKPSQLTSESPSMVRLSHSATPVLRQGLTLSCVDPTLVLISRLEKLRSLKLFVHLESKHTFAAEIKLATDVLNSFVRLHTLTIEIEYQSYDAMVGFLPDWSAETAEVYKRFEESSIRLNTSGVLFVVRSDRRERIVYWTQTLQHIFPTLYNRCQFRVQCQRGERSSTQ